MRWFDARRPGLSAERSRAHAVRDGIRASRESARVGSGRSRSTSLMGDGEFAEVVLSLPREPLRAWGGWPAEGRPGGGRHGKRQCSCTSPAPDAAGSEALDQTARTKVPRLSFQAPSTDRSIHCGLCLVWLSRRRGDRRRSAWDAGRSSIRPTARRILAVTRIQGTSLLEF
jgi:hypothetical protein